MQLEGQKVGVFYEPLAAKDHNSLITSVPPSSFSQGGVHFKICTNVRYIFWNKDIFMDASKICANSLLQICGQDTIPFFYIIY
jgi:hypothetical protein